MGQSAQGSSGCGALYNYMEDGKQTGKLYDRSYDGDDLHFACKSYKTGDWKISEHAGGDGLNEGFEECAFEGLPAYEYRFDAPMTEADNERLLEERRLWH